MVKKTIRTLFVVVVLGSMPSAVQAQPPGAGNPGLGRAPQRLDDIHRASQELDEQMKKENVVVPQKMFNDDYLEKQREQLWKSFEEDRKKRERFFAFLQSWGLPLLLLLGGAGAAACRTVSRRE
jgi:hypothetical protein